MARRSILEDLDIELILVVAITCGVVVALFGGCSTVEYKEYYKDGNVKTQYKKEGFIEWSHGSGKVINLPLANPSVINGK